MRKANAFIYKFFSIRLFLYLVFQGSTKGASRTARKHL